MPQLSAEVARRRNTVGINAETVTNVSSTDFPGHYPGEDHAWNLDHFRDNFHIEIHANDPHEAHFSLVGIDASIANAFRRILLSDLPTLAIEDVFVNQNTSIIQDEVLAHRLGLIPLQGDKEGLKWLKWRKKEEDDVPADPSTDENTIIIHLNVECTWKPEGKARAKVGESDPLLLYDNSHIYAHHLEFKPTGRQTDHFSGDGAIKPVHPNILIAKLRPGHSIDIVSHAIKGVGRDHAKFSPVATASYRLLPTIDILEPILGDDARKFAKCFPKGVIGIEDDRDGQKRAVVKNTYKDTVSRECLRHDEFKDKVKLGRRRDHFIFSIESVGQQESEELFLESIKLLKSKCKKMKRCLEELKTYG